MASKAKTVKPEEQRYAIRWIGDRVFVYDPEDAALRDAMRRIIKARDAEVGMDGNHFNALKKGKWLSL